MRTRIAAVAVATLTAATVVGTAATASASAGAWGGAWGSPGVLSGNNIQIPINIENNFCGNDFGFLDFFDFDGGNVCINR